MENRKNEAPLSKRTIWVNLLIIIAVGFIGIWIAYFAVAIFTKHGEETVVPSVEKMTYTRAVELLHARGFNVDIRDSVFRDDIKPGYVIEQFPKANSVVKPGRKIFLYINAVHPKEVVIDDGGDKAGLALKNWSYRQVKARLTELGFKNVGTITVLGSDDRVVKITANGKPVFQMQKIPVNARIIIEVSDGRLTAIRDSLYDSERHNLRNFDDPYLNEGSLYDNYGPTDGEGVTNTEEENSSIDFFELPEEEEAENE